MKYDPNAARRRGVENAPGKVDLNTVYSIECLPAASKKRRHVSLWDPRVPMYGPVRHLMVNFQWLRDLGLPNGAICTGADCPWCALTWEWNNQLTLTCHRCGQERPRGRFPLDPARRSAGRRTKVCLVCVRLVRRKETQARQAYIKSPIKKCTKCSMVKSKDQFYKHTIATDGYESQCKDCKISGVRRRRRNKR